MVRTCYSSSLITLSLSLHFLSSFLLFTTNRYITSLEFKGVLLDSTAASLQY
jgi:hypothetical protein